jgi:hypothetical protein
MVTKSIIDIDVKDEKFRQFFEMFSEYQEKLKEAPESWKKLDEVTGAGAAALGAAVSVLLEPLQQSVAHTAGIEHYLKAAVKAQEQFKRATHQSENGLKKMGREASQVAHTIFGIGKFILKTGAIGGGLFAGGLFGLDRLGQSAVSSQRSALGLGLTTGQYRAFSTDLGRYLNPAILSSVSQSQSDFTGRVWLSRATGLSPDQVSQMNAGDLSARLAIRAHDWWQNTPARLRTVQNLQATGFQQVGLSLEDMKRLGATPIGQLRQAQAQYAHDAAQLNISKAATNQLYAFTRQLHLAGQTMETFFANKLAALGPALGKFMTSLEKDAEILIGEILTPANLKRIANGMDDLTNYLGKVNFQKIGQDIVSFGSTVAAIAGYIAKLFNLTPSTAKEPTVSQIANSPAFKENPKKTAIGQWASSHYLADLAGTGTAKPGSPVDHFYHWLANTYGVSDNAMLSNTKHAYVNKAKAGALFGQLESAQGLPSGILSALAANESSFDARAQSLKGAQGLFQLMPGVSRALGIQNPWDWRQNTLGAVTLLGQLKKRYHGDIRKELAAWNWNPSSLDADIRKHGSDWASYAPDETKVFMSRVLRSMQANQRKSVTLSINNRTGSNVAISTNAAGL